MPIGDIGIWTGAGSVIPGTTFAAYDILSTQSRNDGIYTDAGTGLLEFDEAGLFLVTWDIHYQDGSNGRANYQTRAVQTTGSGDFFTSYHTGYNRNTANQLASVKGFCFINAALNDQITIQHRRDTDAPTTGTVAARCNLKVVKLGNSGDFDYAIYESTTGGALGGTTPNDVTWNTIVVETDTNSIQRQAGNTDIALRRDNARYMCIYTVAGDAGGSRTQRVSRAVSGSTLIPASGSYFYQRNGNNEYGGILGFFMHEVGTTDENMSIQVWRGDGVANGDGGADVDGSWNNSTGEETGLLVIDMPDHWNTAAFYDPTGGETVIGATQINIDVFDTQLWADTPFSRTDAENMDITSAIDVLAMGTTVSARNNVGSGTRGTSGLTWEIEGVIQVLGEHIQYVRGNQGTQDTHGGGWLFGGIYAVAANDTFQAVNVDRGDNGSSDNTRANYSGAFFLDLDNLEAGGSTINTVTLSDSIAVTDPLDAIMRDRDVTTRDEEVEVGDDVFMLRERYRVLFDAIDAIDNAIATYVSTGGVINNETLTDSLEVNDDVFMLRTRIRVLADSLEAFDSIDYHRVRHQVLSDSLTVTDLQAIMLRLRQRVLTDTVPTYSRPTLHKHTVTITNNVVSLFDSLVATVTSEIINSATLTDTIELNDFLIALSRLRYRLITDSIDAVDALSISRLRPELLADDLAVTDGIVRYAIRARLITDTVSTADALDALRQRYRNLFDSLEIQDATDVIRYRNRLMAETVQVIDSAIEDRLRQRTLIDEVQLSEAMLALRQRFRVINDSIIVVDNIVVTTGGITVNTRTVQDAIDVSDLTLQIIRYRNRRQTESMIVVDVIDDITTRPRLATDSIEVSDNAAVLRQFWRRNVDTLDVTDLQLATVSRLRTLFDNVDITDEDTTAKLAFLFDSIDVTDDLIRVVLRQSVLTDAFTVLDSYAKQIVGPTEVTFITHGVESLPIDLGVEVFHIKTGVEQET